MEFIWLGIALYDVKSINKPIMNCSPALSTTRPQQLGCGRVSSRFYCQRTIVIAWLHLALVLLLTQLRSWWWGRGWCCPSYIIVGLLSTLSHRHYSATTWAYTNVRPSDRSATKCGGGWTTYSLLQIHLVIKLSYNYTYPLNCTHCIFSWLFLSRAQIRKYVSICLNVKHWAFRI